MERFRRPYATFRHAGAMPFASIQGHEAAMLMEKTIEG